MRGLNAIRDRLRVLVAVVVSPGIAGLAPAQAQHLPPDVTACTVSGYAIAADRRGVPVRSEANAKSKILGRLAPQQKALPDRDVDEYPREGLWRTRFDIIGYKDGWFLIEKAIHPYNDRSYGVASERRSTGGVKTFGGRGWIPVSVAGGILTDDAKLPPGALYSEPDAKAERIPAKGTQGGIRRDIGEGRSPKKVFACQGKWIKLESDDGVTGWWNSMCSPPKPGCG